MTFQEFEPTVARLRKVYTDRAFPHERVEIIFRSVKYVDIEVWNETLSELIGDAMHAPSLSKIKEVMNSVRKRMGRVDDGWDWLRGEIQERIHTQPFCPKCANSGVFSAYRKADPHQETFVKACDCFVGARAIWLPENKGKIRMWDLQQALEWAISCYSDVEMPAIASRQRARLTVVGAIKSSDLNTAVGLPTTPPRGYRGDKWESDL